MGDEKKKERAALIVEMATISLVCVCMCQGVSLVEFLEQDSALYGGQGRGGVGTASGMGGKWGGVWVGGNSFR